MIDQLPYFRLYAAELLADEHTSQFTDEELGCWLRLVCYAWVNGSIPRNPAQIAKLIRRTPENFKPIWDVIGGRFTAAPNSPDRVISCRLENERVGAVRAREDKSRAGRISGQVRRGNSFSKSPRRTLKQKTNSVRTSVSEQTNPPLPSPPLPSSPHQPASQSLSIVNGSESSESRLADFREKLGQALHLGHAVSVGGNGKNPIAYFEAQLTTVPESALIADCCELAKRSTSGTPSSLAWFVPWLERLPEASQ